MEEIKVDTGAITAVPAIRDESYFPFKKFVLASNFGVPSRNPTTGDSGGALLYWVELYSTDVNGYIGLGPGYITLNRPGIYHVAARVCFRLDTPNNTHCLNHIELDINSPAGVLTDGSIARIGSYTSASSSLYVDETSGQFMNPGETGGTSITTSCYLGVDYRAESAPPRYVTVFVRQQSDLLQQQDLVPHNHDVWLQVAYLGKQDVIVEGLTALQ